MGRFNLNLPIKPAGTVKIGEGTEYEVEFTVPAPLGDEWDNLIPALMKKSKQFYDMRNIGDSVEDQLDAVADLNTLMKTAMDDEFERLLKIILSIEEEPDAIPYLHKYFSKMKIMELFSEAVGKITERAFGGGEVEEALGKLNGDEAKVVQ